MMPFRTYLKAIFELGGRRILRTELISIPLGFLLARSYELHISSNISFKGYLRNCNYYIVGRI